MHTLFALEDIYGLTVCETGGEVCLHVNKDKCKAADDLLQMLTTWQGQAARLTNKEITQEEYDQWRYQYPKFDTSQHWAKTPSKELSDTLVGQFKDRLKD